MQQPNPLTRSDTLLGVCQAIGEDVGVNPTFLRVGFGVMLFWNMGAAVAAYLAIGLVVLTVRLSMPARAAAPVAGLPVADNDEVAEATRLAA